MKIDIRFDYADERNTPVNMASALIELYLNHNIHNTSEYIICRRSELKELAEHIQVYLNNTDHLINPL